MQNRPFHGAVFSALNYKKNDNSTHSTNKDIFRQKQTVEKGGLDLNVGEFCDIIQIQSQRGRKYKTKE